MAYVRMSGTAGAFGWHQGQALVLGGLDERREYLLLGETGEQRFVSDGQGGARVPLACGAPLCVAEGERVILYDPGRVDREAAAALVASRRAPVPERRAEPPAAIAQEEMLEEEEPPVAEAVAYRAPSQEPPVDRLPELIWPEGAAQLRPYFEKHTPLRLLDAPGWRTVQVREGSVLYCLGRHVLSDRVDEVMYALRARGSMIPPKGLQGYRYERLADGGYWVLRQKV